jgi:hypothetical protein
MERWYAYEKIQVQIERICEASGGDHECTIFFFNEKKRKYALHFSIVFDLRYANEAAFGSRVAKQPWPDPAVMAGIYTVEDSDYLKFFEDQTSGTVPWLENIRHFILFDTIDTAIELLAYRDDPVLIEIAE